MKKIQIINGPNLNLLGKREPTVYGNASFEDYLSELRARFPQCEISYYQSNVEGEIINKIHEVGFEYDGIVLNAGAISILPLRCTMLSRRLLRQSWKCISRMCMPVNRFVMCR